MLCKLVDSIRSAAGKFISLFSIPNCKPKQGRILRILKTSPVNICQVGRQFIALVDTHTHGYFLPTWIRSSSYAFFSLCSRNRHCLADIISYVYIICCIFKYYELFSLDVTD